MRPLTLDDVLSREAFRSKRPQLLPQIMGDKAVRRVHVGPNMTLLFENHATLLWQVHEMARVENISKPAALQDELDAYNPLLPSKSELSATLLVEYPNETERAEMLVKLSGIHLHLHVELEGAGAAQAVFEGGREKETGKVSSVQFLRIPLTDAKRRAFFDLGRSAKLVFDHPVYSHSVELSAVSRGALIDDLRAD